MLYVQVRPRFCKDPLFDTITEEAERVRLFKEYIKTVKVGMCVFVFVFFAVYMFCAIWKFAHSRDCVVHSQNPEIAFQSRDCTNYA